MKRQQLVADQSGPHQLSPSVEPPGRDLFLFRYLPFLVVASLTFAASPDDTFFTLRYAANLVHGSGLAINPGEYVLDFTNPLDLIVAAVLYLIPGGSALLKMKAASLLFGMLSVREASRLLNGLGLPRWASRVGCFVAATCPVIAFASGNGLEATLEMWLLASIARRLVLGEPGRSSLIIGTFACAVALAERLGIVELATLDRRHFNVVRPRHADTLTLIP